MTFSADRASLLLSVNRALWGEVGPALRAVHVAANGAAIMLRFYFDGHVTETDRESASCVAAEVVADFPDSTIKEQIMRLDAPQSIPYEDGWQIVYMRREQAP